MERRTAGEGCSQLSSRSLAASVPKPSASSRTQLNAGANSAPYPGSTLKEKTDSCSGTDSPSSSAAWYTPRATLSVSVMTAVISGERVRHARVAR
ncbi:hypothetical protein D3C81_2000930 [compost metagenome]